jgi:hypothetical protein
LTFLSDGLGGRQWRAAMRHWCMSSIRTFACLDLLSTGHSRMRTSLWKSRQWSASTHLMESIAKKYRLMYFSSVLLFLSVGTREEVANTP